MKHIFTKVEYKAFIDAHLHEIKYSDEFVYVDELFQSSIYWDRKICGINHLLSVVIEQLVKSGKNPNMVVDFVYNLPDQCNFEIQETSEWFIDELYQMTLNSGLDLEDYLIMVQGKLP